MCLTATTGSMAQTVETFRQPYPAGEKISPNPNFTGEVWLAPISEQKELNVPMAYGHMGICLHLGITHKQLTALLNIVEVNLGPASATPLREVLKSLTTKK